MDLSIRKLSLMAAEDGVSEDEFINFANEVCGKIIEHSPSGSFKVVLSKSGRQKPLDVSLGPTFRASLVELMYQLRKCAPWERQITMLNKDGKQPAVLTVRTLRH